jgi:murein DD-endopeptidase MepM/ murein hydrolase activator NlpD
METARVRVMRSMGGVLAAVVLAVTAGAGGIPRAFSAPSEDGPGIVAVRPSSPVQGDTIAIVVSAALASAVSVRFDDANVAVYALPDGTRRALIGTDPTGGVGSHTIAIAVAQEGRAPVRITRAVRIAPGHFMVRTLTLPPQTFGLITPENAAIERRALNPVLGRRTPRALWMGAFVAPSTGPMDSPYGDQSVYNGRRMWWHQGMDYAASEGSPVVAANAGVVVLAQALPLGGKTAVIDHGQGVLSEYLHLSAFAVPVGARVERGALIARIGATGLVTGPSLHWGLYVNGTWVNPSFWMEPRPGLTQ